ncbi:hypothetical protein [Cryptosporangium arvum]|uniref:hypothetical protein n=1 Tax=Cryptosporangium arvum TaxID=80871 RepID=UPI0004B37543|nr:hypothetical protein [Cryptosporangium arvum]
MKILLGLALVILAALAVRWLITARRQNVLPEHDRDEILGPHLPLRPSGQVSRALRANGYTEVRRADEEPEPGSGPMLRP